MRRIIPSDPDVRPGLYLFEGSAWPARWIGHSEACAGEPVVLALRHRFHVTSESVRRIHVSADERYELFLDGERIGRGSERGDVWNWSYETYDLSLDPGEHVIVARVWWLGADAPLAQSSVSPAFLLYGDGLSTGVGNWEVIAVDGYGFSQPVVTGFTGVGSRTNIDGRRYPWGVERGEGSGWIAAIDRGPARIRALRYESEGRFLRPAQLPAMRESFLRAGRARHVTAPVESNFVVRSTDDLSDERRAWSEMLAGRASVVVEAGCHRRVLVDLCDYRCAYSDLVVSGGRDATVTIQWAEALYLRDGGRLSKGNRDDIDGREFIGMGSTYVIDGGDRRTYSPLWWDAGRYVALEIATGDEPLVIESFTLRDTGYPFEWTAKFAASDPRLAEMIPLAWRTLEACAHETYMDCPYYEQLMYVGDTRIEVLTTYASTPDDRLPRKAIELFDLSRDTDGFTASRYPSRMRQRIPTFSMWWVGMVHDFAHWRDDLAFVAARMPGVRAVCEAVRAHLEPDGLIRTQAGWNFVDWVPGWPKGIPPKGDHGLKATVNWQAVLMFQQAAELEELMAEPGLAARYRATAARIIAAIDARFWSEDQGLYAEDLDHEVFSEHAQCLAIIGGGAHAEKLARTLVEADLDRTTIYFSHYLFEAYRLLERPDLILRRMELWFGLRERGFRTTPEAPEPTRSDCHAWGAHPVFHFFATLIGIRPSSAGFATVEIRPQLGPLDWLEGETPHPCGTIKVSLRRSENAVIGSVELPIGVSGTFVHPDGRRSPLDPGPNAI